MTGWDFEREPAAAAPDRLPFETDAVLRTVTNPDARYAIGLVLCPPPDVLAEVRSGSRPEAYALAAAVRRRLRREGWGTHRIGAAWRRLQFWYYNTF